MNNATNKNEEKYSMEEKICIMPMIIYFCIVAVGLIALTLYALHDCNEREKLRNQITEEKRELASLQLQGENKESAEGRHFMFGTGYYKSETKNKTCYYFYEKQPEGGFQLVELGADDVQICPELEDGEQPYEIIAKDGLDTVKYRLMYLPKDAMQMQYDADISNMEAKNAAT